MTKLTSINGRQTINALELDKITHELRGFKIIYFNWNNEFNIQDIRYSLHTSMLHIYAKDEHVVFIKKWIGKGKYKTQ